MDWIRENKSLATIVGIFLAGSVALGGVLVMSHLSYGESLDKMTSLSGKVTSLEKASIYPSEANVDSFGEKIAEYENAVGDLSGVLLKLQPPVADITDTDFQAKLKTKSAETREDAAKRSVKLPKDFAFGFNEYTTKLPSTPEAARQLNDYFDAVSAVVKTAMEAGVSAIDNLQRSELAVEKPNASATAKPVAAPKKKAPAPAKKGAKGKPAPKPPKDIAQVVERRQLTLTLTTDQIGLQTLTNALASATKMPFFTVVRMLRIENEKQEGPLRNAPIAVDPTLLTPQKEPPAPKTPGEDASAPKAEVITAPKPAPPDAQAVMGKEMLKVFLDIDLIRFLAPPSETADAGAAK